VILARVFKLDLVLLHFVNIILLYLFHEAKRVDVALDDPDGVISIQEDLNNFTRNQVWELVERIKNHNVFGTKWSTITKKMKMVLW
jgi:hypothetical protein